MLLLHLLQHTNPHTAARCNTLQHAAPYCNMLQYAAKYCNILKYTTTLCIAWQHTATHSNTRHPPAMHCNALQRTATHELPPARTNTGDALQQTNHAAACCTELTRTVTHGNATQRITIHLQHATLPTHEWLPVRKKTYDARALVDCDVARWAVRAE